MLIKACRQRAFFLFKTRHPYLNVIHLGNKVVGILALALAHADFL